MTAQIYDTIPALSQGFLSTPTCRQIGNGVIIAGEYQVEKFTRDLFDQLDIPRPESLSRAVDKRLADFLAGRFAAKLAQEALGHTAQPIAIGPNRAPIWPDHTAGSISHARGRYACYALPREFGDPGIDVEQIATGPSLDAILKMTVNETERSILDQSLDEARDATLVFSGKEALFKALYPTVGRHFGFACAQLVALPSDGVMQFELTEKLHPLLTEGVRFELSYEMDGDHVTTWMTYKPS